MNPRSRGTSLIELLVALALGLLLAAGALRLAAGHIDTQRRQLLESRLTQDLRSVVELIARDVRRAGYWGDASQATRGATDRPGSRPVNPYRGVVLTGPADTPWLGYSYSRDLTEDDVNGNQEKFGLRLNPATQAIEWRLSGSAVTPDERDHWQALTDPALMRVTRLAIRLDEQPQNLLALCPLTTCSTGADCPPERLQRQVQVDIEARDAQDARVTMRLSVTSRLRNDEVRGDCPA
jgi:type IV pilus assembly protein PilW